MYYYSMFKLGSFCLGRHAWHFIFGEVIPRTQLCENHSGTETWPHNSKIFIFTFYDANPGNGISITQPQG